MSETKRIPQRQLVEIMERVECEERGIAHMDSHRKDMNRALDTLPPEEARRMKRKFRKAWRKAARSAAADIGTPVGSIKDIEWGRDKPSRKARAARKRLVMMDVTIAAMRRADDAGE